MNKKTASILTVLVIVVFVAYIVLDTISPRKEKETAVIDDSSLTDQEKWKLLRVVHPAAGSLKAVAVSPDGTIFLGGDSWVACLDKEFKLIWNLITPKPVTSLSVSGDTIFAATAETILLINTQGTKIDDEWGPYEDNAIITSVTSNKSFVSFADAGNRIVIVLKKNGDLKTIIGKSDKSFVVPSPYFDVALAPDNTLYVANTGNRRIEKRTLDGDLITYFGLPGTAPDAFCGCCNPAHFALSRDGFITAEKGINRIKTLNKEGKFVEFISLVNKFIPSIPLDIATIDGSTLYAANPVDSKLYIFIPK